MEFESNESILAVITIKKETIEGGGVPTIYCESEEEREKIAVSLSRITSGMIHDLENGSYILVKH